MSQPPTASFADAAVFDFDDASIPPARGFWTQAFRRLLRNRFALAGLVVIGVFVLLAVLAPLVAPADPSNQDYRNTFASPSLHHLAGTDNLGRDWFSRLLYGARVSIAVGVFAQVIIVAIGLPLGLIAGYKGGLVDSVIMRFADLVYAFPDLLLVILLRSALGGGVFSLFTIIGIVAWVDLCRLVRGQAMSLREREFVEAARSLGATNREIIVRHLLPNLAGPLTVMVAFGIPRAVFVEATLSFIGFGVSTGTPSWGTMVQEGYSAIFTHANLVIFPAGALALLMLAFTFVGDGLRDALDPRTQATGSYRLPDLHKATTTTPAPPKADEAIETRRAA